jgi:cobalt-zinc-cadmium efflux system outer membrane protein
VRSLFSRCVSLSALLTLTMGAVWGNPASQELAGPESGVPLTGDDLASWVLEVNPGLSAIRSAATAAAYRVESAGSLADPTLGYAVAPLTANADRSLNQQLAFSQELPWPGILAAREAAARHEAVAASRDTDALRLRIVAQAKSAHAEWRFVHEGLAIYRATRELLDELIAAALTRYAAGHALKQDVLQAEVERANLDKYLLLLAKQQTNVRARINALLNRAPETPLPAAAAIPMQSAPPALEALQILALAQHPALSRLDAQVSASQSRVTLAEKAFYPNFKVGVAYNGVMDDTDKRPLIGVSINVPLNRSKRRADLGRAQADTRRVQWSLVERRAELLSDLAQARAEVLEAQASIALYQDKLVPLAAEYLEAVLVDYRSGAGAFLNVITAEQRKLSTDLELARARSDYARRLAELERWVGGSIEKVRTTPTGAQQ